jgi:outer membrane protein assembly factor BamE (lipoprotein component of BamABCDE complex)
MQVHRQFASGRKSPKLLAALPVFGLLAACSPTLETHGHLPDPEIVGSVRIGMSNREQVTAMLGTPSAISTFDNGSWYYVGSRTSWFAFLEPEILERTVLVIRFDKDGIVRQVERLSKEDGRDVQIVERKTPTRGRELTILEQLIGNLGRFGGGSTGEGGVLGDP